MISSIEEICPSCCKLSGIEIRYGYPGAESAKLAKQGKIRLGGCITTVIEIEGKDVKINPNRFRTACGFKWRSEARV